jgi:ubiquinol-cytochrome c reductase cytochrome c subunit
MATAHTARRRLAAWALLLCSAGALVLARSPEPAAAVTEPDALHRGGELYQRWCATCHATTADGTRDGPTLEGLSLAYVDLTMRTGRMPLADPERGVRDHTLDPEERELVNAYLADLLDLDEQIPDPPAGDPGQGQELYTLHCAACHGSTGQGGVTGAGLLAPAVTGLDRTALASATRVGPFAMPPFREDTLSDDELGDVVDYVLAFDDQPTSPLGMTELNRVSAAAFGALLLALLMVACVYLARWRTPGQDEREKDHA